MKKIIFAIAVSTVILAAGCSGKGAYSEEEKKTMDSSDNARQEQGFDALQEAADSNATAGDTSAQSQ